MVEDATVKNENYQVVQVQIIATQRTYDYAWRGAEPLKPGDWVKLPGNVVSADGSLGRVASTNPPSWKGELKEILERTDAPDPWKARFAAVRSRDEASRLWHRAKHDPAMTPQRLQECVDAANESLAKLSASGSRQTAPSGHVHRWVYGDDENGHSGDVCDVCGADRDDAEPSPVQYRPSVAQQRAAQARREPAPQTYEPPF